MVRVLIVYSINKNSKIQKHVGEIRIKIFLSFAWQIGQFENEKVYNNNRHKNCHVRCGWCCIVGMVLLFFASLVGFGELFLFELLLQQQHLIQVLHWVFRHSKLSVIRQQVRRKGVDHSCWDGQHTQPNIWDLKIEIWNLKFEIWLSSVFGCRY